LQSESADRCHAITAWATRWTDGRLQPPLTWAEPSDSHGPAVRVLSMALTAPGTSRSRSSPHATAFTKCCCSDQLPSTTIGATSEPSWGIVMEPNRAKVRADDLAARPGGALLA